MSMKTAGARWLDGLGIYTVIYLIFIYGPVLVLPVFSFNDSIYVAFPLKGFIEFPIPVSKFYSTSHKIVVLFALPRATSFQ